MWISAAERRDIDRGLGQGRQHGLDVVGADGREIALQIDHDVGLPCGIELAQRLEDPVRAGGVVGPRHDRLAAMGFDDLGDLGGVGRHRDPADFGGFGAAQHVDDHRQAGDVQKRFSGQPGGGHAGGDQHQSAGIWHRQKRSGPGAITAGNAWGLVGCPAHLYGLPEHGQTDISGPAGCGAKA